MKSGQSFTSPFAHSVSCLRACNVDRTDPGNLQPLGAGSWARQAPRQERLPQQGALPICTDLHEMLKKRQDMATHLAICLALSPGWPGAFVAPRHPTMSRHAACAGRLVPPPMVPTSIDGMLTDTCVLNSHTKDNHQRTFNIGRNYRAQ